MKRSPYNILLVDDHPMTLEGYRNILNHMHEDFVISEAQGIDTAIHTIQKQPNILPFELAFIDIGLPKSKTTNITSGEGVALALKEKFPLVKIIVPTLYTQAERIHHILNTIEPDALLLKTEFNSKEIMLAIETVLKGQKYFSGRVNRILQSDDLGLDRWDLKILYCISKQIKMKDIPNHVPLTLRTIEERKSVLMDKLEVPPRNNALLVQVAKEKGLI